VPPNISPSGCLNHRSQEKALGDAARKIASTVVIGQVSSGMIGTASLSFLSASLPGPLALPPPRSRGSPGARRSVHVVDLKAFFSF